jgi:hypothetical protein
MKLIKIIRWPLVLGAAMVCSPVFSQVDDGSEEYKSFNPIMTAVPFMTIAPDVRSAGMGDVGVATTPDVNSQHWNAAKYAFMENSYGFGFSYTPWLRKLVNNVDLTYVSGYFKLGQNQAISASLRYFGLGEMSITDEEGNYIQTVKPNEFAVDVAYSRKFGENIAAALTLRYIHSDLTGGYSSDESYLEPGNAFAADAGIFYTTPINEQHDQLSFGFTLSNIGTKMSYGENVRKSYLPMNMRLGGSYKWNVDPYNSLSFNLDLNKYLVPTPQAPQSDPLNPGQIVVGVGDDKSVVDAIFSSFSDAPGGFSEEIKEITMGAGTEYAYQDQFMLRAGYYYDSKMKGNRRYFSFGASLKYQMLTIDMAYLAPVNDNNNPLANTLKFGLSFVFGKASPSVRPL